MDQTIFEFIRRLTGHSRLLDLLAVFFATPAIFFLFIGFVLIILQKRHWRERLYGLLLGLFSVLLARGLAVEVIRFFYQRPRPYAALVFKPLIAMDFSPSFPSGHAATAFAVAAALWFLDRRWSYLFLAGALLVALARVAVGVHWPSDVVAGAALGGLSAWIARKILPLADSR